MFENYGLRDVFSGFRKYLPYLILIFIVSILLGGMAGLRKVNNENGTELETWTANAVFVVMPDESIEAEKENTFGPDQIAQTYKRLTDYDIYKKNVLDVLGRRYTSDEIREHAALPQNGETVTAQEIAPFITTETGSPSIISIKTTAPDEQFAKDLLDACNTVLLNDLRPQVDKGYLNYLGQTVSVEKESSTYTEMTALKYAIAYCVAGIVLACIVIFIITLAQPTINRKSDFEKYGIPVIGEMYPSRGRKVARS